VDLIIHPSLERRFNMKLIELTNNVAQTVATGAPVVLGSISRRVSMFTDYSAPATTLTIREAGYYEITLKVNATATVATQPMEITMFIDGTEQPETLATHIGTAIGDVETLNTHKKIRVFACSDASISFVNTGADDTTYTALILDIKKVC
jgi:hypothetical protein